MPLSSRSSGSPRSGFRWSSASAARTFRFGSGGSCRSTSAVSRRKNTRRLGTTCGNLLPEELVEVVRAALAAIERTLVPEDLRVELGVGHDLEGGVEARRLVVAHEDSSRAPMFRDGDALIPARDVVDESTELRLRLGQRQRLHDLTSLQTNCGSHHVGAILCSQHSATHETHFVRSRARPRARPDSAS